jgi:large conductance mechanosensitive channel
MGEGRGRITNHYLRGASMLKDFKAFIMRGNVIDLAIGVIIGIAFGAVVKSLVDDVIMPPIGMATGGIDFSNKFVVLKDGAAAAGPYASVAAAKAAGATTLNYGLFVNNVVSFLIIAFCAFIIVRMVNKLMNPHGTPDVPKTKPCPYCAMDIPITATRCPNCTSQL